MDEVGERLIQIQFMLAGLGTGMEHILEAYYTWKKETILQAAVASIDQISGMEIEDSTLSNSCGTDGGGVDPIEDGVDEYDSNATQQLSVNEVNNEEGTSHPA